MSVFITAEAGCNHLGDRDNMLALCDAAKWAGADAVKFQAFSATMLIERRKIQDPDTANLLYATELSDSDLDAIAAHCEKIGIKHFYSVFQPHQIERVLSRGACALKVSHVESGWHELVDKCWGNKVPVWVSSTERIHANVPVPMQHAVWCPGDGEYPADGRDPELHRVGVNWYREDGRFTEGFHGFSSHFTDYRIPAAAALRGAEYIEAHLCLGTPAYKYGNESWNEHYKEQYASQEPEADWSLCPDDFKKMVELIREYEGWL